MQPRRNFKPEYTYTEYNGKDVTLTVNYDIFGCMSDLYLYNTVLGTIEVNLESLESQQPSRFNYLQERINESLTIMQDHFNQVTS